MATKVTSNDFNDFFSRLENIRKNHVALGNLTSTQKNNLSTSYDSKKVTQNSKVEKSAVDDVVDCLNNLTNSPYITNTFSSNIVIPNVGDLLKLSNTNIEINISNVENICANCSFFTSTTQQGNFTNHTSATQQGNFTNHTSATQQGNFTNHTSATQQGDFNNYASASQQGNFGNQTVCGSNFTSNASKGNYSQDTSFCFANFTSAANRGNYTNSSSQGNYSANNSNFTNSSSRSFM